MLSVQRVLDDRHPMAKSLSRARGSLIVPAAMAITQIHTHRRNRHGSWRDGEGGALDASRPSVPQVNGGADNAAPTESSKSDAKPPRSALFVAVRHSVSLEDASPANASARGGT